MKTKAAFVSSADGPWQVAELDLDPPKAHEVLIRYVAAGLCHSDEHLRVDGFWADTARYPMVGGHEGAGIVEAVGEGVTRVKVGDHIVCSFVPVCGICRFCSTGQQNLCDMGASLMQGTLTDGTFRFHRDGVDYGGNCMLGTFSQYGVLSEYSCVAIDRDIPLDVAVLIGCGVPTGWGSAVYTAEVTPGDTVVIYGSGGIGSNSVQGAVHAGATNLVVVDPQVKKRDFAASLGATHCVETKDAAEELVRTLTRGVGADKAIITMGIVEAETVRSAFNTIRKGGTLVITGLAALNDLTCAVPSGDLTLMQKTIKGTLYGGGNPLYEIPKMLGMYRAGQLKLEELVTRSYALEDINKGYDDMWAGRNIRGIIRF